MSMLPNAGEWMNVPRTAKASGKGMMIERLHMSCCIATLTTMPWTPQARVAFTPARCQRIGFPR